MNWIAERYTTYPDGRLEVEIVAMFAHYDDAAEFCDMKCAQGEYTKLRPNR